MKTTNLEKKLMLSLIKHKRIINTQPWIRKKYVISVLGKEMAEKFEKKYGYQKFILAVRKKGKKIFETRRYAYYYHLERFLGGTK